MTTELALTRPDPTLTMDVLRAQMEAAKRYVDSGLLPNGIKTPQQALTIMQVGREIGVPATYALRNIHVIEGKPTCAAELLMGLVRRTYGQAAIRVKDATNQSCTVEYREQGWDGVSSLTFTIEDAKNAGLAAKPMWTKYPRAMLRSRAVSEAVRTAFPECIAGLYTPEEMGAEVRVAADGTVEIAVDASTGAQSGTPDPGATRGVFSPPEPARGQKITFLTSDEDVKRWLGAWFGTVKGSSLDTNEARARFVRDWTRDWPKAKQTDSLRTLFARMTADEAEEFLAHVRALMEDERNERSTSESGQE